MTCTYIFDVKNGPVVELSEHKPFDGLLAAQCHAAHLAASARSMWQDTEGWLVEICDASGIVIDTVSIGDVEDGVATPSAREEQRRAA